MKVQFDFDIDDLMDVYLRSISQSGQRLWRWDEALMVGIFIGIASIVFIDKTSQSRGIYVAIAFIAGAVGFGFLRHQQYLRTLRKYCKEYFGRVERLTCQVELLTEGIRILQRDEQSMHQWEEVGKVNVKADSLEFCDGTGILLVVRNRAFKSEEEKRQFVRIATEYLDSAKKHNSQS